MLAAAQPCTGPPSTQRGTEVQMSQRALSRGIERGANRPGATSHMQMSPHPAENALALDPPAAPRDRDQELVRFVGRHGLVAIRHVMATLGVGRTAAYRRVGCCVEAGLLERVDLLRTEPRATACHPRRTELRRPRAAAGEDQSRHRRAPSALHEHRATPRRALRPRSGSQRARDRPGRADRRPRPGQRRPRRTPRQDPPAPPRPRRPHR